MSNQSPVLNKVDRVGAFISFACAIHCLALPLCLSILPLVGLSFLASDVFEVSMIVGAIVFATLSMCWGHRIHGRQHLFGYLAAALVFFAAAHTFHTDVAHAVLMGLGGILLATAHLLNQRLCRSCASCECEH